MGVRSSRLARLKQRQARGKLTPAQREQLLRLLAERKRRELEARRAEIEKAQAQLREWAEKQKTRAPVVIREEKQAARVKVVSKPQRKRRGLFSLLFKRTHKSEPRPSSGRERVKTIKKQESKRKRGEKAQGKKGEKVNKKQEKPQPRLKKKTPQQEVLRKWKKIKERQKIIRRTIEESKRIKERLREKGIAVSHIDSKKLKLGEKLQLYEELEKIEKNESDKIPTAIVLNSSIRKLDGKDLLFFSQELNRLLKEIEEKKMKNAVDFVSNLASSINLGLEGNALREALKAADKLVKEGKNLKDFSYFLKGFYDAGIKGEEAVVSSLVTSKISERLERISRTSYPFPSSFNKLLKAGFSREEAIMNALKIKRIFELTDIKNEVGEGRSFVATIHNLADAGLNKEAIKSLVRVSEKIALNNGKPFSDFLYYFVEELEDMSQSQKKKIKKELPNVLAHCEKIVEKGGEARDFLYSSIDALKAGLEKDELSQYALKEYEIMDKIGSEGWRFHEVIKFEIKTEAEESPEMYKKWFLSDLYKEVIDLSYNLPVKENEISVFAMSFLHGSKLGLKKEKLIRNSLFLSRYIKSRISEYETGSLYPPIMIAETLYLPLIAGLEGEKAVKAAENLSKSWIYRIEKHIDDYIERFYSKMEKRERENYRSFIRFFSESEESSKKREAYDLIKLTKLGVRGEAFYAFSEFAANATEEQTKELIKLLIGEEESLLKFPQALSRVRKLTEEELKETISSINLLINYAADSKELMKNVINFVKGIKTRGKTEKESFTSLMEELRKDSLELVEKEINPDYFVALSSKIIEFTTPDLKSRIMSDVKDTIVGIKETGANAEKFAENLFKAVSKKYSYSQEDVERIKLALKVSLEVARKGFGEKLTKEYLRTLMENRVENLLSMDIFLRLRERTIDILLGSNKLISELELMEEKEEFEKEQKFLEKIKETEKRGEWEALTYIDFLERRAGYDLYSLYEFIEKGGTVLDKLIVEEVESETPLIQVMKNKFSEDEYEEFVKLVYFSKNVLRGEWRLELDLRTFTDFVENMKGRTVLEHYMVTEPGEYDWEKLRKVSFYMPYKGSSVEFRIINEQALLPAGNKVKALKQVITSIKEQVEGKGQWKRLYNSLKKYAEEEKIEKLEDIVNEKNAEEIAKTLIKEASTYELKNKSQTLLRLLEVVNWENTQAVRKNISETTGSERIEWIRTYWEDSIKEPINQGKIKIGKKTKSLINTEISKKLSNIKTIKTGAATQGILRIELSEGEAQDILKGSISSDCTTTFSTAFAHFKDPYTLNFRIYEGNDWIGNIYAAITREKETNKEVLLIDAVQFNTASDITRMKTQDLDKLADNILENITKWAGDKFDAVALGSFGSERGRLKTYLRNKRGKRTTTVEKLGERVFLESIPEGEAKARVIWEKKKREPDKEAEKLADELIRLSNNPVIARELQEIAGREAEEKIREVKDTVVLAFVEEFMRMGAKQAKEQGPPKMTKEGPVPEKAKLFIPPFLAQEFKKTRTPEGAKKAVIRALEYLKEAKEKTDEEVLKKYYEIADEAFSNALTLTEKGLIIDVEGVREKARELLEKQLEKMNEYMKNMEKETKKKEQKRVVVLADEETKKRVEELSFLPKEVLDAFLEHPELLQDYEIRQSIKGVVEAFFKPIRWEQKIRKHLDEIINPIVETTAIHVVLKEKITKKPGLKKKIQKLIKQIEEE